MGEWQFLKCTQSIEAVEHEVNVAGRGEWGQQQLGGVDPVTMGHPAAGGLVGADIAVVEHASPLQVGVHTSGYPALEGPPHHGGRYRVIFFFCSSSYY